MTEPNPATAHPHDKVFLSAHWSNLLMLQWRVPEELLRPHLGPGIELDTFEGATYVSVVGLRFDRTKLLGIGIPFHQSFTEVNLRFYVRREAPDGIRRGVVFISELVPRFWIATIARLFYNEKYRAIPMRHAISNESSSYRWMYGWRAGGRQHRIEASAVGNPTAMAAGSREEFIAEHYWGYSKQRDGSVFEYRVRHPSWKVWSLTDLACDWSPSETYGSALGEILRSQPEFAFVADGSDVTVSWGSKVAVS